MFFVLGFIVALLLTILMLPLLIRFAPVLGLVDQPGTRKVHSEAIPRSGGLSIAFGFFGAALILLPLDHELSALYAGALIVVGFALVDDRFGLNYRWKFVGQILAVLVLMQGGILIERLPFAPMDFSLPWLSYLLTFFFLLGAINAVNLSDGLDGLAAGTSLLSLCLLSLLAYQSGQTSVAFLSSALAGGLVGFLRYNTHPAQVFLGDVGSQFIGIILASLAIMVTQSSQSAFSPLLPLLLLGLPILDTLSVMTLRLYRGRSPFVADSKHIHHQFLALGMYHHEVVAVLYLLQILLVSGTFLLRFQADGLLLLCYGVMTAVLIGLIYFARSHDYMVRANTANSGVDQRNELLRKLDWLYHHTTVLLQWAMALFFLLAFFYIDGISQQQLQFAIWVVVGLLATCLVLRRYPRLAASIASYTASISIVYLMAMADGELFSHWFVDGYLIAMLALLVLSIRITRKTDFRLDTRDLLVLSIVLALSQLPNIDISDGGLGRAALRLTILLYTCEYLLNKKDCNYWFLSSTGIVGILLIASFR